MKTSPLSQIYIRHHLANNRADFVFYEGARSNLFAKLIGQGKRVLDLGCRDGSLTHYYRQGNDITGVDIDSRLLAKFRTRLKAKALYFDLNSQTWPFPRQSFDVVVAGEILEHLFNPEETVEKIFTLLTRRGIFVGSVPNSFHILDRVNFFRGQLSRGFRDKTHVNMFSYSTLSGLLLKKFSQVKIVPLTARRYMFLATHLPGLFADDFVFIAKK